MAWDVRCAQAQAKLDAANFQLIKSIPGLCEICIPKNAGEDTDEDCEETKALQDQNEALSEELIRKRAEFQDQNSELTKKLASAKSNCEQLKIDCAMH